MSIEDATDALGREISGRPGRRLAHLRNIRLCVAVCQAELDQGVADDEAGISALDVEITEAREHLAVAIGAAVSAQEVMLHVPGQEDILTPAVQHRADCEAQVDRLVAKQLAAREAAMPLRRSAAAGRKHLERLDREIAATTAQVDQRWAPYREANTSNRETPETPEARVDREQLLRIKARSPNLFPAAAAQWAKVREHKAAMRALPAGTLPERVAAAFAELRRIVNA